MKPHRYRVSGPGMTALAVVADGRVIERGTSPKLRRLCGVTEEALRAFVARHGWRIEDAPETGEVE